MNTNIVREILIRKKMSQKELASIIGLSVTGLNQILLGRVKPKITTIEKIAAALGVQVSLLISPGPVNVQNGHINVVGESKGEIKHLSDNAAIYTTTAEIDSMKKEIDNLREIIRSKDETIASLKMTIEAIMRN